MHHTIFPRPQFPWCNNSNLQWHRCIHKFMFHIMLTLCHIGSFCPQSTFHLWVCQDIQIVLPILIQQMAVVT
uniref:Uncharacterized protein n=1 Tax=Lotus japonicus TaxID=34305 RepID=I3S606_LOTJA|nr:unknown [Lotus japonicus]